MSQSTSTDVSTEGLASATRRRGDRTATPAKAVGAPRIRVLVVDDHEAVRIGVKAALADEPDLVPIGGVPNAKQALAAARLFEPDVAIVDFQLPGRDGLSLARELKALPSAPRVLIFSAYADATMAIASIVAGADGILSKAGIADGLTHAVRAVARGCALRPPIGPAALRAAGERLDPDDAAILGLLVHRTPEREIANVLGISDHWLNIRRWAMLKQLAPIR